MNSDIDERRPGIYVHVPFCSSICPYCDFFVRKDRGRDKARFLASLLDEIRLLADEKTTYDTIYFGGGTPSQLTAEELATILSALEVSFRLAPIRKLYLEVNPEDVTAERCLEWCDLGVSTLSLGVQSFDDKELRFLGRKHDGEQARRAVQIARDAPFETVSIDLIYGLPDSDLEGWRRTMDVAASQ